MGTLRFADLQTCPPEGLDLTSLTRDECQQLVLPFEAAYHRATWRTGAAMGRRARPGGTPPTRTVRCRRQRIGGYLSSST